MTEPMKPDPWVGRATPRPADPWAQADESYVEQTYVQPDYVQPRYGQPGYILVGEPPRRRRGLRIAVALIGVFAACCAGGATLALLTNAAVRDTFSFGTEPAAADTPGPSVVVTTPAPPAAPGLNTPVRDGKFEFVVSSLACGQDSVGITPISKQAKGQYCVVEVSVENIGTRDQLLLDGVQKAIGADGAEYSPDTSAGLIVNAGTQAWLNNLKPGAKVLGKFVYDVPDGATLARLELHDSAFSNGTMVTL